MSTTREADKVDTPVESAERARLAFRVGIVGHRPNRLPDQHQWPDLQRRLGTILSTVRTTLESFATLTPADAVFYAPGAPVMTAVTPLAEGTDRLFADVALENGYRLFCPLPFDTLTYSKDFTEDQSLADFNRLLAAASADGSVYELDGQRQDGAAAYGAAGALVIRQSDLLVAVWDGVRTHDKPGGTYDTIREALTFNVPVLWICPTAPYAWELFDDLDNFKVRTAGSAVQAVSSAHPGVDDDALRDVIAKLVLAEIRLPADDILAQTSVLHSITEDKHPVHEVQSNRGNATDYFAEKKPKWNFAVFWRWCRNIIVKGKWAIPAVRVPAYIGETEKEWDTAHAPQPLAATDAQLLRHYAFADNQANIYADKHRSAVIGTSLLAALAVFCAVLPVATGRLDHIPQVAELFNDSARLWAVVAIAAIELMILKVMLDTIGRLQKGRWHIRWLEYRMLAEWLRQLRLLAPLGGGRPTPHTPPHQVVYGRPTRSWTYWQLRAITRSILPPSVQVNSAFKAQCLDRLMVATGPSEWGQGSFHNGNWEKCSKLDKWLKEAAEFLTYLAIWCVVIHLGCAFIELILHHKWPFSLFQGPEAAGHVPAHAMPEAGHSTEETKEWYEMVLENLSSLTLIVTAGVPALVAALANINNQGEYSRIAKRSLAMKTWMDQNHAKASHLRGRVIGNTGPALNEILLLSQRVSDTMVQEVADWRVIVHDKPQAPA